MAKATTEQMAKLEPFLAGPTNADGEVSMYCPFHADKVQSAQLNIEKGVWYCFAGCGGGRIDQLIECEGYWISPEGRVPNNGTRPVKVRETTSEALSNKRVHAWHRNLVENKHGARDLLHKQRGINGRIIRAYELGYDTSRRVYTIPIRTYKGALLNVRRYDTNANNGRRKIWGLRGHNAPRLFPAGMLAAAIRTGDAIIICEGEWDALVTIQHGFTVVTRTGAAHVWDPNWNKYFTGLNVYLCHDLDRAGQLGNRLVKKQLASMAKSVSVVELPYSITEKHGKDLTDFFHDGGSRRQLETLLEEARWSE